jgi:anti-sigma-K factor RskA
VQHPSEDDLALLALGEPVPGVADHVEQCPVCDGEVSALRATVATARSSDMLELTAPPPAVWQRIADELGIAEPAAARPDEVVVPLRRPPWRRRLTAAAAALAVAAAATGVLASLAGPSTPDEVRAPLVALGEQASARGEVVLAAGDGQRSLVVEASGLPPADGFYEVWLLDLEGDRMVALGVLDDSGRGRLTVPDGVQVGDYPEVDVSLEPDDGDPAHSGDSVLRGELPA